MRGNTITEYAVMLAVLLALSLGIMHSVARRIQEQYRHVASQMR